MASVMKDSIRGKKFYFLNSFIKKGKGVVHRNAFELCEQHNFFVQCYL